MDKKIALLGIKSPKIESLKTPSTDLWHWIQGLYCYFYKTKQPILIKSNKETEKHGISI
jgi:hypothetical protein